MISKSLLNVSVRVCAAISLLTCGLAAQTPSSKAPVLVVLDSADAPNWQKWTSGTGWRILTPPAETGKAAEKSIDARVLALRTVVESAVRDGSADRARIYLAGRGDAASGVFYVAAREPDLWTAAVALGGSPQPAVDSMRFFAANFTNLPILWISNGSDDRAAAEKLKAAGVNLERRSPEGLTPAGVLEWLSSKHRDEFPPEVDCETTSPQFASCYWIRMTKFDAGARNDVLPSSRVQPGSGAMLDFGQFGYSRDDGGPGILIDWLPEKYNGPLKLNDRIVALGGKPLKDAAEYRDMMEKAAEEKPVVATLQRGNERIRLETRIILPKREETLTARVQAKYVPEEKEIQIVSRTVNEMRVTVPEAWTGAALNWNGTPLVKADRAGCWLLAEEKQLQNAKPCP